jgi:membrane protein required for colicin V production
MIIDIIFTALMLMALFKGIRKGFIVALFSFLAFFIGLAAALKLSAFVATQFSQSIHATGFWLPVISFLLVFLLVAFVVRLGAKWLQKTIELALLGWLNRLLGVIFYALLYVMILSILLFYATEINLLHQDAINASMTYHFIEPWGPSAMNALGKMFHVFSNMFVELEDFFGRFAKKN